MSALTEQDRAMLDLERRFFRLPGSKDAAIRDELDLTPTRYYQLLQQLLDRPEALAAEPTLVGRLRRMREQRRFRRAG